MTAMSAELREREARESLYRVLRNVRPEKVVVVNDDGDETELALRGKAGKWDAVCDAVCAMLDEVERVELRDADDKLKRAWKPPHGNGGERRAARGGDDASELAAAGTMVPLSVAVEIGRMLEAAADNAVKRHMAGQAQVMTAMEALLKDQTRANSEMMRAQSATLKALYDATVARGEAEVAAAAAEAAAEQAAAGESSPADELMGKVMELAGPAMLGMDAKDIGPESARVVAAARKGKPSNGSH